jgi:hypothetical protein
MEVAQLLSTNENFKRTEKALIDFDITSKAAKDLLLT